MVRHTCEARMLPAGEALETHQQEQVGNREPSSECFARSLTYHIRSSAEAAVHSSAVRQVARQAREEVDSDGVGESDL